MIYYNSNTINDWNFGDDNIIKVYKHGAVVFYKFDSEQGGYKVCYAVVEDITQYQETEFEDVYDKATEKWFKLNNLNQYEQYGVYGSGRTITTYNGKLTIDDGYEYEWNGSSWVNLGEVSGSSVVEYIETPTSSPYAGIELLTSPSSQSTPMYYEVDCLVKSSQGDNSILGQKSKKETVSYQMGFESYSSPFYDYGGGRLTTNWSAIGGLNNRIKVGFGVNSGDSKVIIKNLDTSTIVQSATATPKNVTIPLLCNAKYNTNTSGDTIATSGQVKYYGVKIYDNNVLVGDYIPAKNPSTNEYTFYETISQRYCSKIGTGTIEGHEGSIYEYPKYYSEKSEPLDNLTFNTLADAQAYAEANCVYDGMKATIGADIYYFDSTDENGWVKVTEYYIVEDVTSGGASGWTITGSSTYNPQPSYYDDFSVALNSSYQTKVAKVTIYGYENFTYYLRSTGYSSYAYVTSSNVDELTSDPTSMSYSSSSAITNTYNFNRAAGSAVNLSNYRRVTYNNLDKTVEHTFYVVFYDGYYYSSYPPSATLLIPKEQTNENWEQVTFSASSNVASSQKSLYIDGNYSTSGGTQYWYHRWIVGLPSGSHSSYTNNSYYDYCPNVTSSTFTSVAGEQRQVNFTYDNTSNKTLSFRLTDGSNVLTPSDTVYYNMTYYNSCGISSSSSNVTFPRSQSVKVGGRFRFASSSNRHYIYGYSPNISLNTDYYVDNYQSTFDITYTKLSDEAVTITYTTYDPSDVEVPAFKTDITYPYSGGTTSSTTLTSFDVPYSYSYEVSQTSDKFSATSQTYTAGQSSRTISFTLYPNNREFATVADMEAYAYAWEGMKAKVGDTNYKYENGEWVENQHSLPDVPFVLNYNAKQYNASTHSIPMTSGQLNDTDAVAYNNPNNIVDHSADGYITISNSSMRIRKQGQDISLFNRSSNSTSSDLTIVCKAKSTSGENIITNRDGSYNWMYRLKTSGILTFHGTSETGSLSWNASNPDIMSVRTYYDSGTKVKYNNWTQNTSSSPISFTYGSTNTDSSAASALFVGYAWSNTSEQWSGDFYWVYMCQSRLTDEQVQQVIDYNENL